MTGRLRAVAQMPLVGGSAAVMAATALTSLCGFGFWSLLTRTVPAASVGAATSVMSLASTVALLAAAGMPPALTVTLPGLDPARQRGLVYVTLRQAAGRAAAATVLAVAALLVIGGRLPVLASPLVALLVPVTAGSVAASMVVDAACVARRRARGMSVRAGGFAASKLAVVAAVTVPASGVVAGPVPACVLVLAAWAGCGLVSVWAAARWLFRDTPATGDPAPVALPKIGWFYLGEAAGQLPQMLLPLLVALRLGATQAAYFNVAWMVGGVCFMVAPAVASALLADGGHEPERLVGRARLAVAVIGVLLSVPVLVLVGAGGHVLTLFGPGYGAAGATLLVLLAVSAAPDAVTNVTVAVWRVRGRVDAAAWLNTGMAVAALAFAGLTLPWLGIASAGWAWLGAQTGGCLAAALLRRPRPNPPRAGTPALEGDPR